MDMLTSLRRMLSPQFEEDAPSNAGSADFHMPDAPARAPKPRTKPRTPGSNKENGSHSANTPRRAAPRDPGMSPPAKRTQGRTPRTLLGSSPAKGKGTVGFPVRTEHKVHVESDARSNSGFKGLPEKMERELMKSGLRQDDLKADPEAALKAFQRYLYGGPAPLPKSAAPTPLSLANAAAAKPHAPPVTPPRTKPNSRPMDLSPATVAAVPAPPSPRGPAPPSPRAPTPPTPPRAPVTPKKRAPVPPPPQLPRPPQAPSARLPPSKPASKPAPKPVKPSARLPPASPSRRLPPARAVPSRTPPRASGASPSRLPSRPAVPPSRAPRRSGASAGGNAAPRIPPPPPALPPGPFSTGVGGIPRVSNRRTIMSIPPQEPVYIHNKDPSKVFENLRPIGQGASGTVFMANKPDGTKIALKKVRPANKVESDALEMEIRMMCCTRHPNLIKCQETYNWNGFMWISMEYMGGGCLTNVLENLQRTRKRMPEPEIAFVLREVLTGLKFMHGMKRLHRDIKSDNVLLTSSGRVKLADFGFCAELTDQRKKRTTCVGTPYWMAPELIQQREYDYKVDLWSVGILAIECAEWEPPHMDQEPMRAMYLISTLKSPTLREPGLWSSEFHDFLGRCLASNPQRRASATQLLAHPFMMKAADSLAMPPPPPPSSSE